MTKVAVLKLDGSKAGELDLPAAFAEAFRPDLIAKAVNTARANRRQPYGASPMAGKRHSVESWGPGRGVSRVPRLRGGSDAAFMPGSKGGRRAHPPKAEKDWSEKINAKERRKAIRSALAATADADAVRRRGHRFKDGLALPVVVEDALGSVGETAKLVAALEKLGLGDDLARADQGRSQRPGRGKLRGRRYRQPHSVLVVAAEAGPLQRAASNVPGVEFRTVKELNTEALAPGGDAGRLALFTESAIKAIGGWSS